MNPRYLAKGNEVWDLALNEVVGTFAHSFRAEENAASMNLADQRSVAAVVERAEHDKLWLWKNGDHYLAYFHEYPCVSPGGDPLVLGEPAVVAYLRPSHPRKP